jgi:hypothetical protein
MANQTVSVNRNFDDAAIAPLLNGEDITINTAAILTINSDVRWSQQAAVIGNITIDAGTGGKVSVDGREVWWIPFDAGTGNVPALGVLGAADAVGGITGSGEFLGIFTALGVAPSAAASAMPVTGFLKLRRYTAAFADNEIITLAGGATVTVNSATGGQRGWLNIVGEETSTVTVPRVGRFESMGDWFDLGTTNGADDQTFQFYVADQCPALQIETGVGTGIYEWWVCAGTTRWAQANLRVATDERGKLFGCTIGGLITIATRVGNDCGFKPVSGCRVRVPNIHYSSSTSVNWALNLRNGTLATRWDFTTTSAGDIEFDKSSLNIFPSFNQAYAVTVTDCGILDQLLITESATEPMLTRVAVGMAAAINAIPISIASCFSGVTLDNCVSLKHQSEAGELGASITDCDNVTVISGRYMTFGDNVAATIARGAISTGALTLTRVTNSALDDVAVIGASIRLVSCINVSVNDPIFAHLLEGQTTTATLPVSAVDISGASADCVVNGYGGNFAGIANVHPYNALVAIAASFNNEVLNIATSAAPFDCGSANACAGVVAYGGNSSGNLVRRCYVQNARVGAITDTNSDARNVAWDVWGDGADTGFVINGLNAEVRGARGTNPVTGSTAVYGTVFYDTFVSATEGRLVLLANEPSALTGTKLQTTGGVAQYTSTGQVKLVNVNDEITWEMDYFWLGITALQNVAPTFSGTNSGNHVIEFQYDLHSGSGYNGVWLTANGANLSAVGAIDPVMGIKLKVRARCSIAAAGNAIINIRLTATTDATSYLTQQPTGVDAIYSITGLPVGTEVVLFDSTNTEIDRQVIAGTVYNYNYFWNNSIGDLTGVYALVWHQDKYPFKLTGITLGNANQSVPLSLSNDLIYNGTYTPKTLFDFPNMEHDLNTGVSSGSLVDVDIPQIYSEWKDEILLSNNAQYDFYYTIVGGNPTSGPNSIPKYVFQINGSKLSLELVNHSLVLSGGIIIPESGKPYVTPGVFTRDVQYELPVQAIGVNGASTIAPSEAQIKSWVRAELATEMARIDADISSRESEASAAIRAADASSDATALAALIADIPTDPLLDSDTRIDGIKNKTDQLAFTETGLLDANVNKMNNSEVIGTGTDGDPWRGVGVPP